MEDTRSRPRILNPMFLFAMVVLLTLAAFEIFFLTH
jgi:hypothetical protein